MNLLDGPVGGLLVCAQFGESPLVVVAASGELDSATARDLSATLESIGDQGHDHVVLDLSGCEFIDASGLRAIAHAARRFERSEGSLTIRSASSVVRHLLDLTGLAALATSVSEETVGDRLGPEQAVTRARAADSEDVDDGGMPERRTFSTPAVDDMVDSALRLVVALARVLVGGADGVSVSLRRQNRLVTVASSDDTILAMDADQYATGEGPCIDASDHGRWFHAGSLGTETRWPAFTPKAHGLGINAILSSPLSAAGHSVGAINIYSRVTAAFTREDQRLASLLAVQASMMLTDAGVDVTADQLAGRLSDALASRQVIAMAQGVLMERDGGSPEAAYSALRRFSARTAQPLRKRAEDIVASAQWVESRPGPRPEDYYG